MRGEKIDLAIVALPTPPDPAELLGGLKYSHSIADRVIGDPANIANPVL